MLAAEIDLERRIVDLRELWYQLPKVYRIQLFIAILIGSALIGWSTQAAGASSEPRLTLLPNRAMCSTPVEVHGEHFAAGTTVTIFAGPHPGNNFGNVAEVAVTADGTFEVELPLSLFIFECAGGPVTGGEQTYLVGAETNRGPGENGQEDEPSATTTLTFVSGINEHFYSTWARTDLPVSDDQVDRTWIWGPDPFTEVIEEPYTDSPDGVRKVRYYDKARMEITQPDGDTESPWYVTNGLLVVELITGRMQVGDDSFQNREPAEIVVAGDAGAGTPTYATLQGLLDAAPRDEGAVITERLASDGTVSADPALAERDVTAGHHDAVTNHTVATPFWEFMTSTGMIAQGEQFVEGQLFANPYYATGRPVTEAYWATVPVGGEEQDVLLQCFERRCLTYTPRNEEGWQVEAGNVGQHYHEWRYAESGSQ